MTSHFVYLDHAAATPLDKRVLKATLPFLKNEYGNPSSIHKMGLEARKAIDGSRDRVARLLGAHADEIVFTSGATESINLAIRGLLKCHPGHVVSVATEHQASRLSMGENVTFVPIQADGQIRVDDVVKAIRPDTVLVSVMLANNEIGTLYPVAEIGREIMKLRKEAGTSFPLFHSDATQAVNYFQLDVERLHVDLLSISGSKMYGPKGTGALFVRRGVQLSPIIVGGKQEGGLRAGTENVAGVVGFAEAFVLAQTSCEQESRRTTKLRNKLIAGLFKAVPGLALNGSLENRLPNNIHVSVPGIDGEELVLRLDARGIAVSTAAACKGGSEPSHVLQALGLSEERALEGIRLSLGRQTRPKDIAYVLQVLPELVAQMRR